MSYICRTGNLAKTPKLHEGEHGPYTFAKVICTDRIKTKDGEWTDGPAVAYDVAVRGDEAKRLVACAERDGNVRVMFAGRYRITEWTSETGSGLNHEVQADQVGLSLRFQDAGVTKKAPSKPAADAEASSEPRDIFEEGAGE